MKRSIRKITVKKTKKGGFNHTYFSSVFNVIVKITFVKIIINELLKIFRYFFLDDPYLSDKYDELMILMFPLKIFDRFIYGIISTPIIIFMQIGMNEIPYEYYNTVVRFIYILFVKVISIGIITKHSSFIPFNIFKYFKNPSQKKIAKTIINDNNPSTTIKNDNNHKKGGSKFYYENTDYENINNVDIISETIIDNQNKINMDTNAFSELVINENDIEIINSHNTIEAKESLNSILENNKTEKSVEKAMDLIYEMYKKIQNNTKNIGPMITDFLKKQKEIIEKIKDDLMDIGKKQLSFYEKTFYSLNALFILPTIENLEDIFKNPDKEKISKLILTSFGLFSILYIFIKLSINLYKWLFGIKTKENKVDLTKLSPEEKETVKNNEEKLKKIEKELLEKVVKGQKIPTTKKTLSKSK
jgi:hypothetical protein